MEAEALLESLVDLARKQDFALRRMPAEAGPEGPPTSGVAVVRGQVWVLLCDADPPARRSAVLAEALARYCGAELEARYLAPALREALDRARRAL